MIDYSKYPTREAVPEAPDMLTSFRSVGYSIQTAIADIIDNSISASAGNIWIDFDWKGTGTSLSIKDDGTGMTEGELVNAMRPGGGSSRIRTSKDLGRFGLGLKTASFSQCSILSVITRRKEAAQVFWTWDMEFVRNHTKKWELIGYLPEGNWVQQLEALPSGTIIIWSKIDRLLKGLKDGEKKSLDKFLKVMEDIKKHIAMVFHRFIESGRIKIFFRSREIKPWNPFLSTHNATQIFPEEPLQNGLVKLQGFVLPHKSKLTNEEFQQAEGINGWNAQQGFYIYRNQRMLLSGDWLGLFRKEEHHKLARIMLDLPNALDDDWQIDIKKSIARPPVMLREQLTAYALTVRLQAFEIFQYRGKVLQRHTAGGTEISSVWQEKVKHGKRFYEINREHPIIKSVDIKKLGPLLRLLEETVPIPLIFIKESENPDSFSRPFEVSGTGELTKLMQIAYSALLNKYAPDQAKNMLLLVEPFNEYPEIIAGL